MTEFKRAYLALNSEQSEVLNTLYSEGYDYVFRYFMGCFSNNTDKAETLTSDTFWKIQSLLKDDVYCFDSKKSKASSYCVNIAKSVLIDSTRTKVGHRIKTSRFTDLENRNDNVIDGVYDIKASNSYKADSAILASELGVSIDTALYSLTEQNRKIVMLYMVHDYSYNEISNMLDISLSQVKTILNRSRSVLQNVLKNTKKMTLA